MRGNRGGVEHIARSGDRFAAAGLEVVLWSSGRAPQRMPLTTGSRFARVALGPPLGAQERLAGIDERQRLYFWTGGAWQLGNRSVLFASVRFDELGGFYGCGKTQAGGGIVYCVPEDAQKAEGLDVDVPLLDLLPTSGSNLVILSAEAELALMNHRQRTIGKSVKEPWQARGLAGAGELFVSYGPGGARIYEAATLEPRGSLPVEDPLFMSCSEGRAAALTGEGVVLVWELATQRLLARLRWDGHDAATSLAFRTRGTLLLGTTSGELWELQLRARAPR